MSIKQQRGSTQGLVVVSWSRCCGLCSFWGDGERVFLGEGKPDLKYDTFFFFSLFIGGLFFSFHPLREWGTAHLLLTELVSFCNQDLLSGFFPNIFPCCPVGLLCLQLVSSLPTVCVFFSLFHFTSTCFRYLTRAFVVFFVLTYSVYVFSYLFHKMPIADFAVRIYTMLQNASTQSLVMLF